MEVRKENVKNIYPLSPTQEGMLFHHLESPQSEAYLQQISYHVHGELDPAKFEAAWNELARRHDILRTAFVHTNTKQPLQVVLKDLPVDFTFHDISDLDAPRQQTFLDSFRDHDRRTPFDPGRARLMRIALIRLNHAEFEVVWSHHHLITDGWSIGVLQSELVAIYSGLPALPPAPSYSSYIRFLESQDAEAGARFWRDYLAGYSETASIPATASEAAHYREFTFPLTPELERRINDLARDCEVTVSTAIQTLWAILLGRYSGKTDVVFGTVVSGRPPQVPGIERMAGLFVNTVPVRVRLSAHTTLADLMRQLHRDVAAREPHQYFPLSRTQAESELKQSLLGMITAMENYPVESQLQAKRVSNELGFSVDRVRVAERTHYDFLVQFLPGDPLTVKFQYNAGVHTPAAVEQIGRRFLTLLAAAAGNRTLNDLHQSIAESAPTHTLATVFVPIHQRVEQQAAIHPEACAISCEGQRLTYSELNARANGLTNELAAAGVTRETRVGICCARSLDLVVSMLAVLKAGGVYVPMDPAYPADRLAYLIADSEVRLVIADAEGTQALGTDIPLLSPDAAPHAKNPNHDCVTSQAAYIIYTSGSTGRPKGCVVTHENLSRLFTVTENQFSFGPHDVWTLFHSAAFDFSVWEIWGALAYGGRLAIVPYWISRSPSDFFTLLEIERVTVLNQTPSAFRQLLAARGDLNQLALRLVIFGGEALSLQSLQPWFSSPIADRAQLVNMYGITETTVHVTYRPIDRADVEAARGSVIGAPLADLSIHLLDGQSTAVPHGATGEIYVGGAGVARGYWRRPALTAERFVPDPFGPPGARLYRSGDLARRLPDHDLEYLGRGDQQVKIRGFRIELSEIEAVLSSHPLVREAVVIAANDRLVAYVAGPANDTDLSHLRSYLRDKLPDYMNPGILVPLDRLPLTAHGKVDRKALPKPERSRTTTHEPPRTPVEETLAAVWRQVVGVDRIGIHDKYLELGGDSISAIRIVSALLQHGLKLSVRDLFRYPTIETLAPHVQPAVKTTTAALHTAELTPIQAQHLTNHPDPGWFNHAVRIELPHDPERIQRAWQRLWEHHDALRLRFMQNSDGWTQELAPPSPAPQIENSDIEPTRFDLAHGPLVRLVLRGTSLLIVIHHLVIDAVSWRILLEDFETALGGAELPPPTDSYLHWCAALQQHRQTAGFQKAVPYWMAVDSAPPAVLAGWHDGPNVYGDTQTKLLRLPATDLSAACTAYHTNIEDLLLAALAATLGSSPARILVESHGRDGLDGIDLGRTIGWFTSIYPVVLEAPNPTDLARTVKLTKETLRRVPRQGLDYGLWRPAPKADTIRFNYLGNPTSGPARSFAVSTDTTGPAVNPTSSRPVALDISAIILDEHLEISLVASPHQCSQTTLDAFADRYQTRLNEIIRHCCERREAELTPSDLTYSDFTLDEFDRILS